MQSVVGDVGADSISAACQSSPPDGEDDWEGRDLGPQEVNTIH